MCFSKSVKTGFVVLLVLGSTISYVISKPMSATFKDTKELGERYRLYTPADASCNGGIKGKVVSPKLPLEQVLAIPPDDPTKVYMGTIGGENNSEFSFHGLPMGKYDLMIIYANSFYEGLELSREPNTLTKLDMEKINQTLQKSEKFWRVKTLNRIEGTTGRGNFCRGVVTMLKDAEEFAEPAFGLTVDAEGRKNKFRRTFKIFILKDVGPGWQVAKSRDLYPVWANPANAYPKHNFTEKLSKIRVTDYVKDLGDMNLTQEQ